MVDPDVAESSPLESGGDHVDVKRARAQRSPAGAPAPVTPVESRRDWTLLYVAETGSTNDDLIDLARGGAADRTVLRTDHQTTGRGRLDRRWSSPPGANLMVSLLFRRVPSDPTELTRRVSVAAADAVAETTGHQVGLKWPNDLLLDGFKLAGILSQRDDATGAVAVGLGLNTSWSPDGAADLGGAVDPATLLEAILDAYDRQPVGTDTFHEIYRAHLSTLGQWVRVELPGGEMSGRAVDVDDGGHLVIVDECAITHHLSVGDVVHVRRAEPG